MSSSRSRARSFAPRSRSEKRTSVSRARSRWPALGRTGAAARGAGSKASSVPATRMRLPGPRRHAERRLPFTVMSVAVVRGGVVVPAVPVDVQGRPRHGRIRHGDVVLRVATDAGDPLHERDLALHAVRALHDEGRHDSPARLPRRPTRARPSRRPRRARPPSRRWARSAGARPRRHTPYSAQKSAADTYFTASTRPRRRRSESVYGGREQPGWPPDAAARAGRPRSGCGRGSRRGSRAPATTCPAAIAVPFARSPFWNWPAPSGIQLNR